MILPNFEILIQGRDVNCTHVWVYIYERNIKSGKPPEKTRIENRNYQNSSKNYHLAITVMPNDQYTAYTIGIESSLNNRNRSFEISKREFDQCKNKDQLACLALGIYVSSFDGF